MSRPEAKAVGFLSTIKIVKDWESAASYAAFLEALPAETRACVDAPPLPMAWVDMNVYVSVLRVLSRTLWKGLPQKFEALGEERMRRDTNGIYKLLMRFSSPQNIIRRASRLYGTYSRNHGTMHAEMSGENHGIVAYRGCTLAFPEYWHMQLGIVAQLTRSTGVQVLTCKIAAGGGHTSDCDFHVSWR